MVDALRRARELVTKTGCVIDLHPTSDPALVLVGDAVGGLVDTGGAKGRHQAATDAVAAAVRDRLFTVDDTTEFDFSVYGETLDELQQHIHDDWCEGHIGEVTFATAQALLRAAPGPGPPPRGLCAVGWTRRPRVRERVVINRLVPVSP